MLLQTVQAEINSEWIWYVGIKDGLNSQPQLISIVHNRIIVIRERRMRWFGHVTRMDKVRIPKQALHWEVVGFRRRPDELEKCGKEGPPKNGINMGRG